MIWLVLCILYFVFFFFNDTATTEIYTLSLHDALPILVQQKTAINQDAINLLTGALQLPSLEGIKDRLVSARSEEHTSELQSRQYLVCRLLLEKKNTYLKNTFNSHKQIHIIQSFTTTNI